MRKRIVLGLLVSLVGVAAVTAMPAGGKVPGQNGRIAFALFDPALEGTVTAVGAALAAALSLGVARRHHGQGRAVAGRRHARTRQGERSIHA